MPALRRCQLVLMPTPLCTKHAGDDPPALR
jgi:hypothetical protein